MPGAFKTVGYSRVGKPGAPDPSGPLHKPYTWVTVSSHDDIPVYAEAFGVPESHVVPTGIPRVDPMFDLAHRDEALAAIRAAFPATNGRETILFAPTFRGNGARSATYDPAMVDVPRLYELCVERDAVCLVRMHPFVRDQLDVPEAMRDRILDASATATTIEVNDLLFAVDLVITDYSSIVYEYSTGGRCCSTPGTRRLRPGLLRALRLVRAGPDRAPSTMLDAIRRGDFEQHKVAAFAKRLRPPRRRVDRPGDDLIAPVRRLVVTLRILATRRLLAGRCGHRRASSSRRRTRRRCRQPRVLRGARRAHAAGPGRGARLPPPRAGGRARASYAPQLPARERTRSVDDYFFLT
jgi:hypothetical protein